VVSTGFGQRCLGKPAFCHSDPAGHSHKHDIEPLDMVSVRAEDDSWPLLDPCLVGEREGDENEVAEALARRIRHRLDCPKPVGKPPRYEAVLFAHLEEVHEVFHFGDPF
jgi:hypothetical protein